MTITSKLKGLRVKLGSNNSLDRLLVGLSHFHHNFTVLFFYPQVWMNAWKKIVKALPGNICFKHISTVKMFSFFRNNLHPIVDAKKLLEPDHNKLIDRSKFNNGSVDNRIFSCLRFDCINIKTAISVYIASKICKIQLIHVNSFRRVYVIKAY